MWQGLSGVWLTAPTPSPPSPPLSLSLSKLGGGDWRLIYRHYATLYFVFCVDSNESELGILDLIQASLLTELGRLWLKFNLSSLPSLPLSLHRSL